MARAPFQVLVLPFRLVGAGEAEFALLRRTDKALAGHRRRRRG
jgi:hypothetical protein